MERKRYSEFVGGAAGAASGAGAGVAGSTATIAAAGTVPGLSAAGISSGLAAVGGSMIGGVAILTCSVAVLAVGGCVGGAVLARKIHRKRSADQ